MGSSRRLSCEARGHLCGKGAGGPGLVQAGRVFFQFSFGLSYELECALWDFSEPVTLISRSKRLIQV